MKFTAPLLVFSLFLAPGLAEDGSNTVSSAVADAPQETVSVTVSEAALSTAPPKSLNRDSFTPKHLDGTWFIKFFSPYCPHCNALAPKWQKAYAQEGDSEALTWAEVNCAEEGDLCQDQEILSYPQMRIYENGKFLGSYSGDHETSPIVTFAKAIKKDGSGALEAANKAVEALKGGETLEDDPAEVKQKHDEAKEKADALKKEFDQNPKDHADKPSQDNLLTGASPDGSDMAPPLPEEHEPVEEPGAHPADTKGDESSKSDVAAPKSASIQTVEDAIKYAQDTFGQSIEGNPARLVFGDKLEYNHGFRNYEKPNAPPPSWGEIKASYSKGRSYELNAQNFKSKVLESGEHWFLKFYSPRCPHCSAMAPEWEAFAKNVKGKINVGEVNCDANWDLCVERNVKAYPLMQYYKPEMATPSEYTGDRVAEKFEQYALTQSGGQIIPIETLTELDEKLKFNTEEGRTTFVFVYDESVMPEDWTALTELSGRMAATNSVLYRSNSDEIKSNLGIHHHGTAFQYVSKNGEDDRQSFAYPYSNVPLKMRNPDLLEEWVHSIAYQSAQPLELSRTSMVSKIAPVQVILIDQAKGTARTTETTERLRLLRMIAGTAYDNAAKDRVANQERLRMTRLKLRDEAIAAGKLSLANTIVKTPITTPLQFQATYNYIPSDVWQKEFGSVLELSDHKEGQVVVMNLYDGTYIDSLEKPLVIDDVVQVRRAIDLMQSKSDAKNVYIHKFKRKIKDVRKTEIIVPEFVVPGVSPAIKKRVVSVSVIGPVALILLWIAYRKFGRKQFRRSRNQGLLSGKLE